VGDELRLHVSEDGAGVGRLYSLIGPLELSAAIATDRQRLPDLVVSRHAEGDGS